MTIFKDQTAVFQGFHKLITSSLLATTALAAGAVVAPATAQAQAARSYDIPAGSLAVALNSFGEAANVELVYDSALTNGVSSPGLKGSFGTAEALSRLLAGTGLTYRQSGSNAFTLERAPQSADGAIQLGPVRVEGDSAGGAYAGIAPSITSDPNATEGTGSYTARSANAATRMDLSLRETPQSISVITRQQIDDQNLMTLDAVLRQTPGIVADRMDERVTFSSRGFSLGTMLDGVPTLAFNSPAGEASMTSTVFYDRVEVIRGAAGLLNGVGDPGGAINLIRKRPTTEFSGQISAGIGSWSRYAIAADLGGPLNAAGTIRARVIASRTAGDSFIDAKKRSEDVFYGIVEADLTPNTVLAAGYEHQTTAIDGSNFGQSPLFYSNGVRIDLPRSFSPGTPWSYWNMYSDAFFVNLNHQFGNGWQLKLEARHLKNRRKTRFGYLFNYFPIDADTGDATIEIRDNPVRATNNSVDLYVKGPFEAFGQTHQAVLGFSYNRYSYRVDINSANPTGWDRRDFNFHDLGSFPEPDTFNRLWTQPGKVTTKALYGSVRLKLANPLAVIAGSRVTWYDETSSFYVWPTDTNSIRPAGKARGVITPYAGIVLDLTRTISAYASFTDIFRPNTVRDSDNRLLSPQRGENYEVGLKGEFFDGRLNAAAAIFRTREDNVAVEDLSGAPLPDGSTPYRAVKGARSKGYELTIAGELIPGLQLSGGFTHHAKRDRDGVLLDPNYPRDLLRFASSYTLPGAFNKLTIGGNISYQSGISFDEVNGLGRVSQGGVTLIGLSARYDVSSQLSLSANIENLTDRKYYSGLGAYNGYIYGDPRNVWFRARYRF